MRYLLCSLLTVLLGLSIARADTPFPEDVLEKSYWSSLDQKAKAAFLLGFRVGAGQTAFAKEYMPFAVPERQLALSADQIPKLILGIDNFYRDPENAYVYLYSAMEISLMQLTGAPKEEIAIVLKKARTPIAWK
jgi:hypothetical protein